MKHNTTRQKTPLRNKPLKAVASLHTTKKQHITTTTTTTSLVTPQERALALHHATLLKKSTQFTKNAVQAYMRHFSVGKKRIAQDPKRQKLSLSKKVETALQLTQFSPATQSKSKSLNKITHLEKSIQEKIEWLEGRLSVPIEFLSLHQIQDIYHMFLDIRFTCDLQMWNKVIKMWSQVSALNQIKDERIKHQAQTITMSLLDELVTIQNLGTFTVMKQKQYALPEHLIKFNLRPTEETYTHAMKTLNKTGNYSATLKLYEQYNNVLATIPQTQYLPSPLLPYGPEREQELVQRRLLAHRRQELLHTATNDGHAIQAAVACKNHALIDRIAHDALTERAYEPSAKLHKQYSLSLLHRNQHVANIELFKQFFQPDETQPIITRKELHTRREKQLEYLVGQGLVKKIEKEIQVDDAESDSMLNETKTVIEYVLTSTGQTLDTHLPEFLTDPSLIRASYEPSRESWINLFRSISALHPLPEQQRIKPHEPNGEVNTTEHGLRILDLQTSYQLSKFVYTTDSSLFDKNPEVRAHVYKVAREQYGLQLNNSFFAPMIKAAPTHEVLVEYVNDFHKEVEFLRQKAKENPWTEQELAEQDRIRKVKSMLVIDLNVTENDERMSQMFGRYKEDAKKLGYNEDFYASLQEKLLLNLVDAYVADESTINDINQELNDGDHDEDPHDGTLFSKLRNKKKVQSIDDASNVEPTDTTFLKKNQGSTNFKDAVEDETLAILTGQAEKSESIGQHSIRSGKKEHGVQLYETSLVEMMSKMSKDTTNALLKSTSRQKVKDILHSIATVRAFQAAYGLPTNAQAESNYLESLILMTRRNEIYPPIFCTNDNSLIKYNVASYVPSIDGSLKGDQTPLFNFKDRLTYIHRSLLRREQQVRITLKEIEQSIDNLSTMKYELDEHKRLKHLSLKVLSDAIDALCELAVDASQMRGPFDQENIFIYEGSRAHAALSAIADGQDYPGMKIDADGTKYVPGVTEPAPHQIDNVDIATFAGDGARIKDFSFTMMKDLLQKLLNLADGMNIKQLQDIPLLKPDEYGNPVTDKTYLPLIKACAAHGDFANALLLVESAHQHRNILPTTSILNYIAVAFINSDKPRNAAGVLDIMFSASQPGARHVKPISEQDIHHAVIHGNADDLLKKIENGISKKVLPNMQTVALLIHMYKEQGLLDHVEEIWRRLTFQDDSSWTSFSAVEEQQLIMEVLANEMEGSAGQDRTYAALHEGKFGTNDPGLSLSIEDAYDKALNPRKNPAMRDAIKHDEIRKNMVELLRNRDLESYLPHGAHRDDIDPDYKFKQLRLDSATTTAMIQTFIQLGHPMHALQLYLDQRQRMPVFPIVTPSPTPAYQQAIITNRLTSAADIHNPNDPLTYILAQTSKDTLALQLAINGPEDLSVPISPTKRSLVNADNQLVIFNNTGQNTFDGLGQRIKKQIRYNMAAFTPKMVAAGSTRAQKTTQALHIPKNALINVQNNEELTNNPDQGDEQGAFDALTKTQWPEVDAVASLAVYALRKGNKYLELAHTYKEQSGLQKEVEEHAQILVNSATEVLSQLKRYAIDHPYLPGDDSSMIYFSHSQSHNNIIPSDAGLQLTQPRLLLPLLVETEQLYQHIDTLVYSDVALEESNFKIRYQTTQPVGMKRWFTIFPSMINQCKAIYAQYDERVSIADRLDQLRDQVSDLVSVGRNKPRQNRSAQVIDTAISGSIDIKSSLRNDQTGVIDRGIAHPSTSAFTKEIDVKKVLGDTDLTQEHTKWLGSFKNFLQSKDIIGNIPMASVSSMSDEEKARIKAKLTQQTKQPQLPPSMKNHDADTAITRIPADDKLLEDIDNIDGVVGEPLVNAASRRRQEQEAARLQLATNSKLPQAPHIADELAAKNKALNIEFHGSTTPAVINENKIMKQAQEELDSIPSIVSNCSVARTGMLGVKPSNKLLLPEVQDVKQHLTEQAATQREILSQYESKRKNVARRSRNIDSDGEAIDNNEMIKMQMEQMQLISSYTDTLSKERTATTAAEWLTPHTDLVYAKDVAQRHASVQKRRKATPGMVEDFKTSEQAHLISQLQSLPGEAVPLRPVRPGAIHSSPYGPESFLPPEQFRAPSTVAKLANQETPDQSKFALSTEKQKFTLATHGTAYSDRPGIPTKISQEYLEKYLMGLDADPKDKRNQRAHAQMAQEHDGVIMDPSFIKGGGADAKASDYKHSEGYGTGLHLFRQRSQDKEQGAVMRQRELLLEEFSSEQVVAATAKEGMSHAEKESAQYQDLFEINDHVNIARTGNYNMLTPQDRARRDSVVAAEGYEDLESQLDMLFKSKGTEDALGGFASKKADYGKNFTASKAEEIKRVKELFSTALNAPKDKFGVTNAGRNNKGRSTLLD